MAILLPASFRGVPFAVRTNGAGGGRRLAEHEYPGRDGLYPEDLGRKGRRYRFQGFLVSNSQIYGGGDVALQRELLLAALEAKGPGLLIHPTLGPLTVAVPNFNISDLIDAGSRADLELEFVEYTASGLVGAIASTIGAVLTAAAALDAVATAAFELQAAFTSPSAAVAGEWTATIAAGGQDATALTSLASQLSGNFGRYYAGANSGYLAQGSGSIYAGDKTVQDLVAAAAVARAAMGSLANVVTGDFATFTAAGAGVVADDVQALAKSLPAACADPADALRITSGAAAFQSAGDAPVDDLFRRALLTALCNAATGYQPSSYDDAQCVAAEILALLDGEITNAGDEGQDDVYAALRVLRSAVVQDLQARGGALSPLTTFTLAGNLPALALAERLYGDASRADQLVRQVDPINPLFMPTSFQALER